MVFFFSSRRRHTRWPRDWSSDVCSSDLSPVGPGDAQQLEGMPQLLRRGQVGPTAKIQPIPLTVDRDLLLRRRGGTVLRLVLFAGLLEAADRLLAAPGHPGVRLGPFDARVQAM